jgi:hypothetical protein
MSYRYFLYSKDQLDEKNAILEKRNKSFTPGVVAVNGIRRQFTQISSIPELPRFIDTKVVAEGELSSFRYTKPKVERIKF